MRNNTGRFIVSLLFILGIQIAASIFVDQICSLLHLPYIIGEIIYCLIISIVFGLFNYPNRPLSQAFKDPYFYRHCCIIFIVLFIINMVF